MTTRNLCLKCQKVDGCRIRMITFNSKCGHHKIIEDGHLCLKCYEKYYETLEDDCPKCGTALRMYKIVMNPYLRDFAQNILKVVKPN